MDNVVVKTQKGVLLWRLISAKVIKTVANNAKKYPSSK